MGRITLIKVQEKDKEKCNVFIDGDFSFSAPLEVVLKEGFSVGTVLDCAELNRVICAVERAEAFQKSLSYVSRGLKTKKQVRDYLLRKGYDEELVYECIDKLKEYGYINDVEYAKRYIEGNSKSQGKRLLQYKLMTKGIKRDVAELVYDELDIDSHADAEKIIFKYLKNKEINKENLAKAYRYLISRGFSYEDASFAVSRYMEDN